MFGIRPAILAPLIIIPAVTTVVLIVDGTAFEPHSPVYPSDPCPASAAAERGVYPTTYTEDAKPYSGPGPHTVEFRFSLDEPLPSRWTGADSEPYGAQLVVCEYVEETGLTDIKCEYRGYGQVVLMRTQANYLLLEAKTSRLITRFQVDGHDFCPSVLSYFPGERPGHVDADIDEEKIIRTLRPYIEGEARHGSPSPAKGGGPP